MEAQKAKNGEGERLLRAGVIAATEPKLLNGEEDLTEREPSVMLVDFITQN